MCGVGGMLRSWSVKSHAVQYRHSFSACIYKSIDLIIKYHCLRKFLLFQENPIKGKSVSGLIPVSVACDEQENFYSSLDGILVHHRVTPQHNILQYPFVLLDGERDMRVKCLAQEHIVVSLAPAQTQTV